MDWTSSAFFGDPTILGAIVMVILAILTTIQNWFSNKKTNSKSSEMVEMMQLALKMNQQNIEMNQKNQENYNRLIVVLEKDKTEEDRFDRVLAMNEKALVKIISTEEKIVNTLEVLVGIIKEDREDIRGSLKGTTKKLNEIHVEVSKRR